MIDKDDEEGKNWSAQCAPLIRKDKQAFLPTSSVESIGHDKTRDAALSPKHMITLSYSGSPNNKVDDM